jgi:hypothetical protein
MRMQLKLTSKERLVLYGLARYPGLSDIDLASNIGVDRSTIFKSKRKFRDWKLIKLLNVPSGEAVGAEILTSVFVKYSPTAPFEVRKGSPSYQNWVSYPNCVSHIATDTDSVSTFYSKSLTDFRVNFDPIIDEYYRNDFVEDIHYFHYPFQVSSYSADAALAVNGLFDLTRSDLPVEIIPPKAPLTEDSRLTEKDKLTLYAFVKYPMLSDLELSRRTGISRPTISGKRLAEDLLRADVLLSCAHQARSRSRGSLSGLPGFPQDRSAPVQLSAAGGDLWSLPVNRLSGFKEPHG